MVRKSLFSGIFVAAMIAIAVTIIAIVGSRQGIWEGIGNNRLSLIIEPKDGIAPVLNAVNAARRSVDLVIYELDDPQVERALIAASARGVAVRVILSAGYDGASSTVNAAAFERLAAAHIPVRWSPPYFSLTHEKSLVVDGQRAIIMTFNLVAHYYPTGRDFGIVDDDADDVSAMERTFDADWNGAGAYKGGTGIAAGSDLLWSPGAEMALLDLIRGARQSLLIENEEMADPKITKALIDAAGRGVAVEIVMTGASEWKWDFAELTTAGVRVRTYADSPSAPLYIHAKMIVMDGKRAFVGSQNFSVASLEENRELGVITVNPAVVAGLTDAFASDWRGAAPFVLVK